LLRLLFNGEIVRSASRRGVGRWREAA